MVARMAPKVEGLFILKYCSISKSRPSGANQAGVSPARPIVAQVAGRPAVDSQDEAHHLALVRSKTHPDGHPAPVLLLMFGVHILAEQEMKTSLVFNVNRKGDAITLFCPGFGGYSQLCVKSSA